MGSNPNPNPNPSLNPNPSPNPSPSPNQVIVLLIGTNDLGNGERAAVVLAELGVLVRQLRAARPAATLLVHALFPRGGDAGVPRTAGFRRTGWWDGVRVRVRVRPKTMLT